MSDSTVGRLGIDGVSGRAGFATNSLRTKGSHGQARAWGDYLTTVEAEIAAGPVDGGTSRKMVLEREVVEEESKDILVNVGKGVGAWNQRKEKITQGASNHTKGLMVSS